MTLDEFHIEPEHRAFRGVSALGQAP